jgi:alkanesulfonate monooxygenase SsuD/methylene tetrahydromethanopterin reductase-like flavin-dependent oxidoreductase (luciferase family)
MFSETDEPTLEYWAVVAAIAALVPRPRIGTLVCGNIYRHPAVLAHEAATVDALGGGRFVLGIGAGWQENELAYGIPFYTVARTGQAARSSSSGRSASDVEGDAAAERCFGRQMCRSGGLAVQAL